MAESFDRFTLLPDSLILIIISLLSFKEAARTSILSKRWLHLWDKTTNIEFSEFFFVKFNEPHCRLEFNDPHNRRQTQRRDFLNFMEFWLHNHKESIVEKFSLTISMPKEAVEIVKKCVSFATQHGVKELGLDFSDPNWIERDHEKPEALFELPTHVYEHKALESLKLFSCSFIETELIKLHALKKVSFGWIELTNDAIVALLSNCKMIESLSLKKCWNSTRFDCGSDDLRLTRLLVDSCIFEGAIFTINAPNLTYFKYYGEMNYFEIEKSFVMEEADLDFGLEFDDFDEGGLMHKVIADLHHVKVLTICSYALQVLPMRVGPLRTEYDMNVRHLTIKTNLHNDDLLGVSFFLNSCPMLERLTFELGLGRILDIHELFNLTVIRGSGVNHLLGHGGRHGLNDSEGSLEGLGAGETHNLCPQPIGGTEIQGLNSCPMLERLTFELGLGRILDEDEYDYSSPDGGDDVDDDDYDDGGDDEESSSDDDNQGNWIDNVNIYQCLTSTLKVVEMNNFTAGENELFMLYYLIYFGSVLKRVNINVHKNEAGKVEINRHLQEFVTTVPRTSSDLEIVLC